MKLSVSVRSTVEYGDLLLDEHCYGQDGRTVPYRMTLRIGGFNLKWG